MTASNRHLKKLNISSLLQCLSQLEEILILRVFVILEVDDVELKHIAINFDGLVVGWMHSYLNHPDAAVL